MWLVIHHSIFSMGDHPRLPVDMFLGLHSKSVFNDEHEYVEKWKEGIEEAYGIAKQNAQKPAERSKKYYNTKEVQCCNPVNMSWLKIWHPGEDQAICSWEDIVHIVVSPVGSDLSIYEVKPERGKGCSRGLHRNFLMPCDQLPVETQLEPPKTDQRKQERRHRPQTQIQESEEDSGDEYELH